MVCDLIFSLGEQQLLEHAARMLQNENTKLQVAVLLAERLQTQEDSSDSVNAILRLLCAHCCGDAFILEVFLELLSCMEKKEPIINNIAPLAVSAPTAQIQKILETYCTLTQDRSLLVPIIGSVSELRLSVEQKKSFFTLVEDALTLVEHSDVPTIVQALLQLATPSNAIAVMHIIRLESARVPATTAALLADPVVAAIRARSYCSRAFWAEFHSEISLTPCDVLVIANLLQASKFRTRATACLLQALHHDPQAIATVSATMASSSLGPAALDLLSLALQAGRSAGKSARQRSRALPDKGQHDASKLRSYISRTAVSIFEFHEPLRLQTLTALLSACSFRCTTERGLSTTRTVDDKGGAAASSAQSTRSAWVAARNAAAGVLELARKHPHSMERCSGIIVHFLAQHAPHIDVQVLNLVSAALVLLLRSASAQLSSPQVQQLGIYSSTMMLLQKLLIHPRGGSQRAALVLAGHLLGSDTVLPSDTHLIMSSLQRLPFAPGWQFAADLFRALTRAAGHGLSRDACRRLLDCHLRPAAVESGLLARASTDAAETSNQAPGNHGGAAGSTEGSGLEAEAAERMLGLQECAERALAGREERAELAWGSLCRELEGVVRLKQCLLVVEAAVDESSVVQRAREACGWKVRMPPLESRQADAGEEEGSREEQGPEAQLAQHLTVGVSCWLNFACSLQTVRLAAECADGPGATGGSVRRGGWKGAEARVVLARLAEGMLCWHHLQHRILPAVAALAVANQRADAEGLRALIRMGWEEAYECPSWLLARSLAMLQATSPASVVAILELLRLHNAQVRGGHLTSELEVSVQGQQEGEAEQGVDASMWLRFVTWLTEKTLSLGWEAHCERKENGSADPADGGWMTKMQVVGECYAALASLLQESRESSQSPAAGHCLSRCEVHAAMAKGCTQARAARRDREDAAADEGLVAIVQEWVAGSEWIDDGVAGCLHLELLRLLVRGGEQEGEVGKLARRMVGRVFPVEGAVSEEVVAHARRQVAAQTPTGAVLGTGSEMGGVWHHSRHLMHVALMQLPLGEAVSLIDSWLAAVSGQAPQQGKSRRKGAGRSGAEAWESTSEESVRHTLAAVLDVLCTACDVRVLPDQAAALSCFLGALCTALELLSRVVTACSEEAELLGAVRERGMVLRATSRVFALLRRSVADVADHAKLHLAPAEMEQGVEHLLHRVQGLVQRHARAAAQWAKGAEWAQSKLSEATPRCLLEGELLLHAVHQIQECYHLEADGGGDDSGAPEMPEQLRLVSFEAVFSGRYAAVAQLTETEESEPESEAEDDDDADDGFRVVRKRPRAASPDINTAPPVHRAADDRPNPAVVINFRS